MRRAGGPRRSVWCSLGLREGEARGLREGGAKGREEGGARGRGEEQSRRRALDDRRARGFTVDEATGARNEACLDAEQLERWLAGASTAASLREALDDEGRNRRGENKRGLGHF